MRVSTLLLSLFFTVHSRLLPFFRQPSPTASCSWNNCNSWSSDKNVLNVHLVPHTHDDLGWIKTVDQYYFGSKPSLVPVGVQYIYNTVIDELMKDPARRFSFAETGFLYRWTSTHNDYDRHKLQKLVKNVEMIGGGWVQNDEAASHYVDIIDQMEFGLRRLNRLFGDCGLAQTAWQVDPFGHSREVANLFAMMGYSSLFFARIHYLEKEARLKNKTLEFVWNTSDDLKTNILTGAFFQDNYGPPDGFCFDAMCGDDPIVDQEEMEGYNLPEKLTSFAAHVRKQAKHQRTKHILLLMGSDFQYTNANMWYTNLDKLIAHVNANSSLGIRVFYSTPTCYVKAINEEAPQLSTKDDDFFPYASSNHSFWTGYFTSRPAFKGMIREASSLLQLTRAFSVLASSGTHTDFEVETMQKASGLVQHHDAVTGTAKENVTRDYERRLAAAMKEGESVLGESLEHLVKKSTDALPKQIRCELRNETVCDPIKNLSTFTVTVFNARGHVMNETLTIPYYYKSAVVVDGSKTRLEAQISKTFQNQLPTPSRAPFELSFPIIVPPLGFTTFFVDNSTSIYSKAAKVIHPDRDAEETSIESELIRVEFDASGHISSVVDKSTNVSYPFRQDFFYYEGVGDPRQQTSGAYVFRPKDNTPKNVSTVVKIEFSKGNLSEEARQTFGSWISQIVRVNKKSKDIEFFWTIGPIPDEDIVSKDVITRYSTEIKSQSLFYTDANGRQFMKRTRDGHPSFTYEDTEPVAGNYYPVTTAVYINDKSSQLSVLTDRSQGVTSPVDGVLELMLHRRSFHDDHWGVEEALNEPGTDGKGLVVTGRHIVQIGDVKEAAERQRTGQHDVFHRAEPLFGSLGGRDIDTYKQKFATEFTGLKHPLPPHIHLLSLTKWHASSILLRLEHIFQISEDATVGTPVTVDLKNLFSTINVTSAREVLLAGYREPAVQTPLGEQFNVDLHPMEIRTYIVN